MDLSIGRYVARRGASAAVTLLGITVVTFILIHSVPGDPISYFVARGGSAGVSQDALDHLRRDLHLDRPLPVQYWYWLRGVATADFGRSFITRRPVTEVILEKLPNTFELNFVAFVMAALVGIPVGLMSAARRGRLFDRGSAIVFFLLYSLPTFWVALLLMQLFAVRLQLLPLFGMTSEAARDADGIARLADHLRHLVLPALTLTYGQLAIFARFSRAALTEVVAQDFITTARAKGAGEGAVLWRHAFRNALLPLVTLFGLTVPYLISGSVIVEQIFQWDGMGHLYIASILARDYPMIMGLTVVAAVVTLAASVVADVLYAVVDPRVRLGEKR